MEESMEISGFNEWLEARNMNGYWNRQSQRARVKPYLWKWSEIEIALQKAAELIPMDQTGRRVVQLRNPSLEAGMSHTIHLAFQLVMPGEIAKAHRHVAAAIRYVIKGSSKCFTIVEGERFPMEEGDLVTTPNWTWHDHFNGSDDTVIWVDGLDARLVEYLDAGLRENFASDQQQIERPDEYSLKIAGHARPSWIKTNVLTPPFRYRWSETHETLLALKQSAGDPFDGIKLQYVNPYNGGPTLPTFSCDIQLLRAREKNRSHRHMSTSVYHVLRGEGTTRIEEEDYHWAGGDVFIVPAWHWHRHENTSDADAVLFSISDWPAMAALGFYREEPMD